MQKNQTTDITGVVQGHRDGHGFVVPDDGGADLYLPPNEMRAVLHRDRVTARVARLDRKGRPEGRITGIVQRSTQPIIGRLLQEHGIWLVAPEDKRYGQDVLVTQGGLLNAKAGQIVVVELTEPPALYAQPVGRVCEVLGDVDDPGMEIDIAVRKYGVAHVFSDAALQQAKALPASVQATDLPGRVDVRDVPFVTIDGEDARDFDDAVYCEPTTITGKQAGKTGKQGWRLLVAIADVSHYVTNGSPIDVDAYERATSVYFPRRVIPMLPEKLSNGLCSLNPQVDRLCMVCDMVITAGGDITAYQFYPAVMHSHARLTYTQVAAVLSSTNGPDARRLQDRVDDLLHLHGVYQALLQARVRRGALDLETVETHIVCDDNGHIEKIVPRVRNDAHKLIEEAMLAANVCAADFIAQHAAPALYRIHEGPTPEKVDILRNFLRTLGVAGSVSDEPTPGELATIAEATKTRPDAQQIHTMLLRSMQQAIYTPINSGHFGLAYDSYTHFTSPIRRYPDLLVHRVIKALLHNQTYQLPELPAPGEAQARLAQRLRNRDTAAAQRSKDSQHGKGSKGGKRAATASTRQAMHPDTEAWQAAGLHCSANERRADEASRDVEAWLKCQYMRNYLGEEFTGTVSAVTSFGLFVTLETMFVEGLVHITELGGDYFRFDENRQQLRGERTGVRFALGDTVRVQVIRVDMDGRRIDFRLLRAGDAALAEAASAKAGKTDPSGKTSGKASSKTSGKKSKKTAATAAPTADAATNAITDAITDATDTAEMPEKANDTPQPPAKRSRKKKA